MVRVHAVNNDVLSVLCVRNEGRQRFDIADNILQLEVAIVE